MGLSSFFTNLFGRAKETTAEFSEQAESTIEKVKEAAEPILDTAVEYAEKVSDSINDIIDSVKEAASEITEERLVTETVFDTSEDSVAEINEDSDK
ncbi:YtxH domain-containing protein [Flavobacterium reichenbachii]|uniref:YtxH domain-containing protein n=1 Tax=Flavobacterium reichenbachii TaxID=362418 RepID=A0A085ZQU1_9FLAO|nr:YtxH domain-containing protein [Flavobacterium reichenbachii]KFF06805.1 hypothetical protein IW19_15390 [Flavobacterium reichenbachii]OXB18596.1 hypothetical protein B0A68_00820 [Flavobacterium reichenbachii]